MDISSLLHFDINTFLKATGYLGIFLIVFAESGLFFGFFLPGDSLLFTAGLLASDGFFRFTPLLLLLMLAAVLGDNVGYWFGRRVGPRLFTREDSFFFHPAHVTRTQKFYEDYGGKTLILARFVPIVRTYAPILAGVGNMHYRTFVRYNLIGGILWTTLLSSAGYTLGKAFPETEEYLTFIIIGIILFSFVPIVFELLRRR